jgi:hypothetical protein
VRIGAVGPRQALTSEVVLRDHLQGLPRGRRAVFWLGWGLGSLTGNFVLEDPVEPFLDLVKVYSLTGVRSSGLSHV